MTTYHVNDKTGRVNICRAKMIDSCPLKTKDQKPAPHFSNQYDAKTFIEKSLSKNYGLTSVVDRTKRKKAISIKGMDETTNKELIDDMVKEYNNMLKNDYDNSIDLSLGYYSFTGSSEINRLLHGITEHHGRLINVEINSKYIERLDRIIDTYGMKGPERKLYRYLTLDKNINIEEYIDNTFSKGEYSDTGFMSTTQDVSMIAGYARKFSKHKKFIVLEIDTNKGISLQRGEERIGDLLSFEKERLLPRDMKFSVEDITKKSIKIDPSRKKLLAEFSGYGYNESNAPNIPARTFDVIKLNDKEMN